MDENLSKIESLLAFIEKIDDLIEFPVLDAESLRREVASLQKKTSRLIGELNDVINDYGDRFRYRSNRKVDIFRDATTVRDEYGSAVLKDVISELYIIKAGYGKSITSPVVQKNEIGNDISTNPVQSRTSNQIMDIDKKLQELSDKAESYFQLTKVGPIKSQVNTFENIHFFTDWYFRARDLFSEFFDERDKNYNDFASCDVSGNGYQLSSIFLRIYPIFRILRDRIQASDGKIKSSVFQKLTNKGFIIHGHNDVTKLEVARFVEKSLGKEAIILHEQPNKGKTVIEKFESFSEVDFAIALWTADDLGKAGKETELNARARQNVIFETGYFIGKLGRERVIILFEEGVEMPSDYKGVVYISLSGNWKHDLQQEITSMYL
jgi:hypothetical protein